VNRPASAAADSSRRCAVMRLPPRPPTSQAVRVYQAVHPGHGAQHGPAHGSGCG
jgi:hypothetical protein